MIELKTFLGIIAVILTFAGYAPYFRNILLKKTKPHVYTWLVWSFLTGIGFFIQILDKGGAGSWATGLTSLICFTIFLFALRNGEKDITYSDKSSLFGAGLALILWYLTNNPLTAVILLIIIDALGFYPTFRKSYNKPYEETISTFFLGGLRWIFAIFALQNYSVITYLYPFSLLLTNWTFVGFVIVRRKQNKVL